ncbi:MAG: tRNA lysidine(34) synthetase TilS [Defluviitaleaceae bacterium]|nr:tRNA lysidine(34) synthetase TilS [Defluviitaleaceae bacterium]
MREIVRSTIKKHNMFPNGGGVVIGLSGGADSVALLFCLLELREELSIEIFAAHVNHNLRGVESDNDETFVRELCEKTGIPLKVAQADVNAFAKENRIGTEAAARKLRYTHLEEARHEFSAQAIAVGHNMDDNAETIIMNLCRGAGLKGLGGIPPVNQRVTRPLLEVSRAEIEEYLQTAGISHITDASNHSNDYTRNRIRNIIMPLLESEINPNVKTTITRNAEALRDDESFLTEAAQPLFADNPHSEPSIHHEASSHFPRNNNEEIAYLNITNLLVQPPAISRRVIRAKIAQVRGDANDISLAHISAVLDLAKTQTGREIHLPDIIVTKEYENLIFSPLSKRTRNIKYMLSTKIENTPSQCKTPNERVKGARPLAGFGTASQGFILPLCTKSFNYDKIQEPLILRTRQAGDKITLKAGNRLFTKKLQDFFTDEKIAKSRRDSIPLLTHGNDILWIVPYRANAEYEVCDEESDEKKLWVSVWSEYDD